MATTTTNRFTRAIDRLLRRKPKSGQPNLDGLFFQLHDDNDDVDTSWMDAEDLADYREGRVAYFGLSLERRVTVHGETDDLDSLWSIGLHVDDDDLRRFIDGTLDAADVGLLIGYLATVATDMLIEAGIEFIPVLPRMTYDNNPATGRHLGSNWHSWPVTAPYDGQAHTLAHNVAPHGAGIAPGIPHTHKEEA